MVSINIVILENPNSFSNKLPEYTVKESNALSPIKSTHFGAQITSPVSKETEDHIPIIEESLLISKIDSVDQVTIIKEPITETKTVEVSLTHEEIIVERRPTNQTQNNSSISTEAGESSVQSNTQIIIPIKRESVDISKEFYITAEVVIKVKTISEKRTVNENLTRERVTFRDSKGQEYQLN
jgi:uncharacterized protein (TIGR02271 family)